MKNITAAMVSIASSSLLAVWLPQIVYAEAPSPTGGCWSREIVMRPQPDPQSKVTLAGRVVGIEQSSSPWLAPKEIATWLRVSAATGEQKLIYLGSQRLLKQQHLKFKVGEKVVVSGFSISTTTQPTIVATILGKGNRTWKIDNFTDQQRQAKSCKYMG